MMQEGYKIIGEKNANTSDSADIIALRKDIDMIDNKLMALLNERFLLAERIGQIKSSDGLAIKSSSREDLILKGCERYEDFCSNIREVYSRIFEESRKIQHNEH